jgi:hypothetical protein
MTLPEIRELAASARRHARAARDTLDAARYASSAPLMQAAISEAYDDAWRAHERMCELMRALDGDA